MSAIKVKPLMWTQGSKRWWNGCIGNKRLAGIYLNIPPSYSVSFTVDLCVPYAPLRSLSPTVTYPTLEAAQAAAQDEWNRFVLSALEL